MKTCPNCHTLNRDTARFCTKCAVPFASDMICGICGASNAPGAKFCGSCGKAILTSGAAAVLPVASAGGVQTPIPAALVSTGKLAANTLVAGRYLIIHKIGQGGMGAVYLVNDTRLGNRKCALKEMSNAALKTPREQQEAVNEFRREAQMLSNLSHPNLPRVTDFFSEGDTHFLVMDYLEGGTLESLLDARSQPFPETQVLVWADQLCGVLAYLHSQNPPVIFRDLKPGNIMVSPDGSTVKLIDFGIARLFRPGANKDTRALGTPGYASPEQYGKGQSDARSDVFALGATLHHVLTLRDPGLDPLNFRRLRSLNPQVSPEVEAAVHRALELQASARWQSVQAMQQALCAGPMPASLQQGGAMGVAPRQPVQASPRRQMPPPLVVSPPPPTVVTPLVPAAPMQVFASPQAPVRYADHGSRIAAYLIDSLILGIGSLVISLPFLSSSDDTVFVILIILMSIWSLGYYTYFHSHGGQTPGKKIAKIRVERKDGLPITPRSALWRAIVFIAPPALLTAVCFVGWLLYLFPLVEKEHRGLHDLIAGTWVVKA